MSDTEISQTRLGLVLLLYAAGLGAAFQFAKLATSFTEVQALYPAPEVVQGLIVSLISFVGILLGVVAGQLVASFGFRRMIVIGLLLGALMSLFQALLPSLPLFLASRLIEGLSHLAIVVAAPTLMNQVCLPKHRYLAMTLWSSFFGVAFALLAWLAPDIISTFGIGGLYLLHGIYMLAVTAVLAIRLPKDQSQNTPFPKWKDIWARHISAYKSPYESAPALGWLCYTLTFVSILTVFPPLLPDAQRALTVPLMPFASILSSFTISAFLLRHLPAVQVVRIGFLSAAMLALVFYLLPPNGWVLVGLFAALGLIQSASFAAVPQLNKTPTGQAHANGAMAQMGNTGNTLGTPVMLGCLVAFGVQAVPIMLGLCFVAGWALHGWLARKRARLEAGT